MRLPSPKNVKFFEADAHIVIDMDAAAVTENMQSNAAAFEAWALALHLWLHNRPEIALSWEVPPRTKTGRLNPHYQRFLYRVERFRTLFPEWFSVQCQEHLREWDALYRGDLYLNMADVRPTREEAALLPVVNSKREARLEHALWLAPEFKEQFGLNEVDRQLPVGLYTAERPTMNDIVFTGQKSAIDLVGLGQGALWLFELKARSNIPMGTLSELLFYAGVLQDAAGSNARFRFPGRNPSKGSYVHPKHVRECASIKAVILVEELHPLLEHPDLLSTLNAATAHWSVNGAVPVQFEAWRVHGFEKQSRISFSQLPELVPLISSS